MIHCSSEKQYNDVQYVNRPYNNNNLRWTQLISSLTRKNLLVPFYDPRGWAWQLIPTGIITQYAKQFFPKNFQCYFILITHSLILLNIFSKPFKLAYYGSNEIRLHNNICKEEPEIKKSLTLLEFKKLAYKLFLILF